MRPNRSWQANMAGEAVKNFILFVVILRNRASVLFFTAAKEALRDAELG
jgi:hypothetical protein